MRVEGFRGILEVVSDMRSKALKFPRIQLQMCLTDKKCMRFQRRTIEDLIQIAIRRLLACKATCFLDEGGERKPQIGLRTPVLSYPVRLSPQNWHGLACFYMGGCQNYGPFLDPYYNTGPNLGDPERDHNFDNPPYPSPKVRSGLRVKGLRFRKKGKPPNVDKGILTISPKL